MSYAKYPKEMKEAVIARMLQGDETVTDIQRDTGIGINTLYRWRDKGIYPEQVKEWKEACINANDNAGEQNTKACK